MFPRGKESHCKLKWLAQGIQLISGGNHNSHPGRLAQFGKTHLPNNLDCELDSALPCVLPRFSGILPRTQKALGPHSLMLEPDSGVFPPKPFHTCHPCGPSSLWSSLLSRSSGLLRWWFIASSSAGAQSLMRLASASELSVLPVQPYSSPLTAGQVYPWSRVNRTQELTQLNPNFLPQASSGSFLSFHSEELE